ncbi:thaumatin-like protein [Cicer arietinum]|uniref:thaumatin-like protein n=1 Tax=Cicer arietinum TaxID=3827 RepID=UPI003CC69D99
MQTYSTGASTLHHYRIRSTPSNTGQPIIAYGGFCLASSQTKKIQAPWSWSGRIWASTGCNFDSNSWKPSCETGDSDGKLACNGLIGTPPATLDEITLQGDKGKTNFYGVSLVDGYIVPVSITPSKNINSKCNIEGCLKDVKSLCPNELQSLESVKKKEEEEAKKKEVQLKAVKADGKSAEEVKDNGAIY